MANLTKLEGLSWPLPVQAIQRIGDSVTDKRPGSGRPHHGIDIFAPAGTEVLSAAAGEVIQRGDGRFSQASHRRRAGLFLDVQGAGGIIYRYLHLGTAPFGVGEVVQRGMVIGTIAPAFTSGASKPHLHFEMRVGHDSSASDGYGKALAPDKLLPRRNA